MASSGSKLTHWGQKWGNVPFSSISSWASGETHPWNHELVLLCFLCTNWSSLTPIRRMLIHISSKEPQFRIWSLAWCWPRESLEYRGLSSSFWQAPVRELARDCRRDTRRPHASASCGCHAACHQLVGLQIYTYIYIYVAQTVNVCLQCGRPGFDSWVGKIPWRRKWQSTTALLPGKFHGRRGLIGYSPSGRKELDTTERLHSCICVCV